MHRLIIAPTISLLAHIGFFVRQTKYKTIATIGKTSANTNHQKELLSLMAIFLQFGQIPLSVISPSHCGHFICKPPIKKKYQ